MALKLPKVCVQKTKSGNYLFSTVRGEDGKSKRISFGREGDPATEEKIARFRDAYMAGQFKKAKRKANPNDCSVAYLCTEFLLAAKNDYSPTSQEPQKYVRILRALVLFCGAERTADFGLHRLEEFRQTLIDSGRLCRKEINARIQRVKRVIRWGAQRRLVPIAVQTEVALIDNLRRGRNRTNDNPAVRPVPLDVVARTLPHLSSVVGAMVRLQLLTGARPEEIRIMRPCDIERTDSGCWKYHPSHDKTERFRADGQKKTIPLNAAAKAIITAHSLDLDADSEQYIFRPAEALREHRAERRRTRKTPMTPSQRARDHQRAKTPREKIADHYTAHAYRTAVQRAAERAGVPRWTPYQLRHTAATEIRRRYGIEAAQILLQHKSLTTTQIYAEPDMEKAEKLAEKIEGFLG
ncbi:MAG: tyrosine-type recombinase/integrase [Thermoguttaceae bacterium]|nr:tyrosine-type recombinase/integrase [Thermoguttaceae bacterium]